MAITKSQTATGALAQYSTGSYTDSQATPVAMVVTPGFNPQHIRVTNATTRVQADWYAGLAVNNVILTAAAGTRTLDTSGNYITVQQPSTVQANADDNTTISGATYQSALTVAPNFTFTYAAGGIAQNDLLVWEARG